MCLHLTAKVVIFVSRTALVQLGNARREGQVCVLRDDPGILHSRGKNYKLLESPSRFAKT